MSPIAIMWLSAVSLNVIMAALRIVAELRLRHYQRKRDNLKG